MSDAPPKIIEIEHDDYIAKHVGWTVDSRQFFLTTPFEPPFGSGPGAEFIALYLFDTDGKLIEAIIDDLGPRASLDKSKARQLYESRLSQLGELRFSRIKVAPFSVHRFGIEFGLVLRQPEEEGEPWAVEAQPGNYMAFFDPWDSGEYDT